MFIYLDKNVRIPVVLYRYEHIPMVYLDKCVRISISVLIIDMCASVPVVLYRQGVFVSVDLYRVI